MLVDLCVGYKSPLSRVTLFHAVAPARTQRPVSRPDVRSVMQQVHECTITNWLRERYWP